MRDHKTSYKLYEPRVPIERRRRFSFAAAWAAILDFYDRPTGPGVPIERAVVTSRAEVLRDTKKDGRPAGKQTETERGRRMSE